MQLRNTGVGEVKVTVKDNSYKRGTISKMVASAHESSITLPLDKSHGWYDFTVQAEVSGAETRFAGRVDTGRSSFSDPLMGSLV